MLMFDKQTNRHRGKWISADFLLLLFLLRFLKGSGSRVDGPPSTKDGADFPSGSGCPMDFRAFLAINRRRLIVGGAAALFFFPSAMQIVRGVIYKLCADGCPRDGYFFVYHETLTQSRRLISNAAGMPELREQVDTSLRPPQP